MTNMTSVMGCGFTLFLVAALLSCSLTVTGRPVGTEKPSDLELAVEKKLNELNRPAVKTIESEDGDIIDCVDMYKQPSLDHPLLKNHVIRVPAWSQADSAKKLLGRQPWHKSGTCPVGTVPIVRVKKEVLMNFAASSSSSSLDDFGRKPPSTVMKQVKVIGVNDSKVDVLGIPENHAVAVVGTMGEGYIGAKAGIDVWNPHVENSDEYSSTQIWIQGGGDSLEAGWMVNPSLSKDRNSRIFTYWSSNDGKNGCYNMNCPGFIQISKTICMGAVISPTSAYGGVRRGFEFYIRKDETTNDWHLTVSGEYVGYFPSELVFNMSGQANVVMFGGDVYSSKLGTPHTATGMGSGHPAHEGYGHAAVFDKVQVVPFTLGLAYPENPFVLTNQPLCYGAEYNSNNGVLFFGGSGRDDYYCN